MNLQLDPLFLFWLLCVIFALYMVITDERDGR